MKLSTDHTRTGAAILASLFTLALAPALSAAPAASASPSPSPASERADDTDAAPEKAQALLDEVKKTELNREIAAKQTAIDRLNEDLEKNKKDAESLQKTINNTSDLISQSTSRYENLVAERKRLQRELNLTIARSEAEGERIEGLRNLSAAQGKSLGVLTRHIEETEVRAQLREAEKQAIASGKLAPGEDPVDAKRHPELFKLRKNLALAEARSASDEKLARAALKTATAKVQSADAAAARVQRMAEQAAAPEEKTEAAAAAPEKAQSGEAAHQAAPPKAVAVKDEAHAAKKQPEPVGERRPQAKH